MGRDSQGLAWSHSSQPIPGNRPRPVEASHSPPWGIHVYPPGCPALLLLGTVFMSCLQSSAQGCSKPAGKGPELNLQVHLHRLCVRFATGGVGWGILCTRGAGTWLLGLHCSFGSATGAPWSCAMLRLIQSPSPVPFHRSSEHPRPFPAEYPHVPLHRQQLRRGEAQALHRLSRGQLPRAIVRDCGEPVHEPGRFGWRGAVRTSHGAL